MNENPIYYMVFGEHFAFIGCNQYFIVGEAAKAEPRNITISYNHKGIVQKQFKPNS